MKRPVSNTLFMFLLMSLLALFAGIKEGLVLMVIMGVAGSIIFGVTACIALTKEFNQND